MVSFEYSALIDRLADEMSAAGSAMICTPEDLHIKMLEARDDERRRIARDLHDVLAQQLLALEFEIQSLRGGRDESRIRAHNAAQNRIGELQRQIRSFSYLLNPPELDRFGLGESLSSLVAGLAARTGIDMVFDGSGYRPAASREAELAMFRVAQAALMNVYKHSGARHARVRLTSRQDWQVLRIRDNGRWKRSSGGTERSGRGVGLSGMQARMAGLCGRFSVRAGDHGTVVTAIAPRLLNNRCPLNVAQFGANGGFRAL